MENETKLAKQVAEMAAVGTPVAEMAAQTGKSASAVVQALLRWLRRTGRTDTAPWVAPDEAAAIADALQREAPPTMTQLANELQVSLAAVRLVAAALWNAAHPIGDLAPTPRPANGVIDLPALLAARLSMPQLVRATGLHPATLELHIAAFLASQPEPDAAPWLTDAELGHVNALLDGPNAWFNLRRAQARSETTRGKVAIAMALRGQWQPRPVGKRPPLPAHHGKAWSHAEDVLVRSGHAAPTPLGELATALARSPEAVLVRARHLDLLAAQAAWPV